ncbi:MAG: ribonuclease III domain-containing protein, partial [Microcystaceae cyanobacterium]
MKAFTHRSCRNENPGIADNERLEFLGDAVINFTVGDFLYQYYPNYSEAELTQLRSQLIDEAQLAQFARLLNIGE